MSAHVFESQYSLGGQILPLPERRDPTEAEIVAARKADRIPLSVLCREWKWSVEDVDQAIGARGFPKPIGRVIEGHTLGEPFYSRSAIKEWYANFLAFAATLPKTVR